MAHPMHSKPGSVQRSAFGDLACIHLLSQGIPRLTSPLSSDFDFFVVSVACPKMVACPSYLWKPNGPFFGESATRLTWSLPGMLR